MLYLDTSFVAPLILQEPSTDIVERFLSGVPAGELAISHWTRVEFSSLLAREVRMGGLDPATAAEADAQFEILADDSFVVLLPDRADYDLAKTYLQNHESGLRAGDALHLAIAANRSAKAIYTFDKTMAKAGTVLGLPISQGPDPRDV